MTVHVSCHPYAGHSAGLNSENPDMPLHVFKPRPRTNQTPWGPAAPKTLHPPPSPTQWHPTPADAGVGPYHKYGIFA